MNRNDEMPSEFAAIEERLRQERPQATGVELDELKLRAMRQARPGTQLKGSLMKSRFALLLVIVAGLMMSTTGATLAITGSSGSGSAARLQYVVGQQQGNGNGDTLGADQGGTGNQGAENGSEPANAQDNQQVAATSGSGGGLPFTGFLAIPLMIGGVSLLGGGLLLRRRATD
jgi:hypothetical protein